MDGVMTRDRLLGLCIGALVFVPIASDASIPYTKLMAVPIMFDALPASQRDKLVLTVTVQHQAASDHAPIHLWTEIDGRRAAIPLTDAGIVDLPIQPKWVAAGADVQTDQPTGSLVLSCNLSIKIPPGAVLRTGYLRDAARQAQYVLDKGTRSRVGFLAAFVSPKVSGVKMKLAVSHGQTARIVEGSRALPLSQDGDGEVMVPMRALDDFQDAALTVSSQVIEIGPWLN